MTSKYGRPPQKWKTTSKMEDDPKNGRQLQKWKTTSKMEDDLKNGRQPQKPTMTTFSTSKGPPSISSLSKNDPLNLHTFPKCPHLILNDYKKWLRKSDAKGSPEADYRDALSIQKWKMTSKMEDNLKNGRQPQKWKTTLKMEDGCKCLV